MRLFSVFSKGTQVSNKYNTSLGVSFKIKKTPKEVFFMSKMTEIVTMKTVENVTKERFVQLVEDLEQNYHRNQAGFIDSELMYNETESQWLMVQHWRSEAELKAASHNMFVEPITEAFRMAIDPKQVKIVTFPQVGAWVK